METLFVNNATKEDLKLLRSIAEKLGVDIVLAPKKQFPNPKKSHYGIV